MTLTEAPHGAAQIARHLCRCGCLYRDLPLREKVKEVVGIATVVMDHYRVISLLCQQLSELSDQRAVIMWLAPLFGRVETSAKRHAETGLPGACCDAVVLRRVYHHLTDPAETNLGLRDALRPGGRLVVIDFPPPLAWLWPWPPEGVPGNRGGHGIASKLVIDEVTASGFELKEIVKDWPGPRPLATYGLVFRKPH